MTPLPLSELVARQRRELGTPPSRRSGTISPGAGLGEPRKNRTFTGHYELTLTYFDGPPERRGVNDEVDFFTAVREQLGLRLEPQRSPVEVLVIDGIERPTPD